MPILKCIFFTLNWLTLTSEMHFVKFHSKVASCFQAKESMHPWGWGYYENTKEIIFWYTNKLYIFCHISKTTRNLKLKFWICNKKNMGFHLISKNVLLLLEPGGGGGGWDVIGIRSFKIILTFIWSDTQKAFLLQSQIDFKQVTAGNSMS